MRKFNPRYLYTAAATAAITAAFIAIPAWATSGGGDSSQGKSTAAAPTAPPGAFGLTRANAPSADELKQSRAKLDEFASCLKDHGVEVPAPGSSSRPPQPPSSSEMQQVTKDCGTPPAPPPGFPPLSKKQADEAKKAIGKGDCPFPMPPPARSGS
jgi:hypothetical protein